MEQRRRKKGEQREQPRLGAWGEHQCGRQMEADYYLVLDEAKFHVYVAVMNAGLPKAFGADPASMELGMGPLALRFDWHDDSTFLTTPFVRQPGHTLLFAGRAPFCQPCLDTEIRKRLQKYSLFKFNCRTVSCMILVEYAHLSVKIVRQLFEKHYTLCGLEESACYTIEELNHWLQYESSESELSSDSVLELSDESPLAPYREEIQAFVNSVFK
jgi:hypothetical protein